MGSASIVAAGLLAFGVSSPAWASYPDPAAPAVSFSMYTSITSAPGSPGYWAQPDLATIHNQPGTTVAGGGAAPLGPLQPLDGGGSVAATPDGQGLYDVSPDGSVQTTGDATQFSGNLSKLTNWKPNEGSGYLVNPISGIAPTADGKGFWAVDAQGNVYTVGDAHNYGQPGGKIGNADAVGIEATASGNGYWVIASDGGLFTYGDAVFRGYPHANPGITSGNPVTGMTRTPDGGGYWVVQADGTVTPFGDAPGDTAHAGAKGLTVGQTYTDIATNFKGNGYFLVQQTGAVTPVATVPTCLDQQVPGDMGLEPVAITLQCNYGPETFKIDSQPQFGTLSGFDSSTGSVTYTLPDDSNYDPDIDGYQDTFTFSAVNANGGESNTATVTINFLQPSTAHKNAERHIATQGSRGRILAHV